jgi:anti-sigma factor RsiW
MKNTEQLLDLQAYVDGELSEERRRQIEATLPADLDAQELVAGLRQLGTLIRAHEPVATVPAAREFYWNQIRRQIEAEQPKAPAASAALGWLRWLIPAMGVAAVAVVVSTQQTPGEITLAGGGDVTVVDVSSTVFRSESDGVTVHWIQ